MSVVAASAPGGTLNGQAYVRGSPQGSVTFPAGMMPGHYTLFHVAKYDGPNRGRILSIVSIGLNGADWLSGFWGGASGHGYRDGVWLPDQWTNRHGDSWVVSADRPWRYRSQGVDRAQWGDGAGPYSPFQLSINAQQLMSGVPHERSDWAVAAMILYRRQLSESEVAWVEDWISSTYGVGLERPLRELRAALGAGPL